MTLIAFEGIDGAGKSTQIKKLANWLNANGHATCVTCEPTKGEHGKRIRSAQPRLSSKDERAEFVLDRKEHLETCIAPAQKRGEIVLTDRYYYSSMAYQGIRIALERGAQTDDAFDAVIDELRLENEAFAPQADVLVLFKLSPEDAMARIQANRSTADAFETLENLGRVAHAFERVQAIVEKTSSTQIIVVQATEPVEKIEADLRAQLKL